MESFLFEHVPGNSSYPAQRSFAWHPGRLLKSRLDGVDGSVTQRAHGSRYETNDRSLVAGDGTVMVLRLPLLEDFLEFSVGSEIDSLVGSYSFVSISCIAFLELERCTLP